MDFGSAQFWNTVKDISALILSALVFFYAMKKRKALENSPGRSGLKGNGLRAGMLFRGHDSRLKSFRSQKDSECGTDISEECRGQEVAANGFEAALWGADPYQVAVEMAAKGISIEEIARRIEIPRGEIVLAVNFRKSMDRRGLWNSCAPGSVPEMAGRKNLPGAPEISQRV